ncbi:MAG: hypothetical protein JW749_05705 [Sedimentisphaerales bacterium]|nr:hypothetical protein [Sedimentisphaerales bacterium]
MLRKLAVVIIILAMFLSAFGCKKKSAPPTSAQQQKADANTIEVKPQAEFDAQAKKDIDSNNMKAELDRLEKEIEQEAGVRNVK